LTVTKVFVDTLLKTKKEWEIKRGQRGSVRRGPGPGGRAGGIGALGEEEEEDRGKSPLKTRRLGNEGTEEDLTDDLNFFPFLIRNDTGTSLEYWMTTLTTNESLRVGGGGRGEEGGKAAIKKKLFLTEEEGKDKEKEERGSGTINKRVLLKNKSEPLMLDEDRGWEEGEGRQRRGAGDRVSFSNEYFSSQVLNVRLPAFDETVSNLPINKVGVYSVKPGLNLFYSVSYKGMSEILNKQNQKL
jgi:hypothetical protein